MITRLSLLNFSSYAIVKFSKLVDRMIGLLNNKKVIFFCVAFVPFVVKKINHKRHKGHKELHSNL